MAGFEDRKKAQEGKFAHDQEIAFKATARRNKLLGLWAAGKMGLSGEAADAYAAAMRAKIDVERSEAERSQANQQVAARAQEAQRLAQQNQLLEKRELEAVRSLQALKKQPVYKKAWFWSTVAAAGAVVIIGVGLGVGLAPRPPATEGGIYDVDF